jgi:hypothetical protein
MHNVMYSSAFLVSVLKITKVSYYWNRRLGGGDFLQVQAVILKILLYWTLLDSHFYFQGKSKSTQLFPWCRNVFNLIVAQPIKK